MIQPSLPEQLQCPSEEQSCPNNGIEVEPVKDDTVDTPSSPPIQCDFINLENIIPPDVPPIMAKKTQQEIVQNQRKGSLRSSKSVTNGKELCSSKKEVKPKTQRNGKCDYCQRQGVTTRC